MNRSRLSEALKVSDSLDDALERRRAVASWENWDWEVRVSVGRESVLIKGFKGEEPAPKIKEMLLMIIDTEIVMLRHTLTCLGVDE